MHRTNASLFADWQSVTCQRVSELKLSEAKAKYPDCGTFSFGDSKELSDWLLSLVRSGKKTATCEALHVFESESESMPKAGNIEVVLNWDGSPALAIRTLCVEIARFCDVTESFALSEGEDQDLEGWQMNHQEYFERNGGFKQEMELVCERFKLVEDFA